MGKKTKEKFVDDGRTIANMNIDGMPWYNPSKPDKKNALDNKQEDVLGAKDTLYIIKGVVGAALLVALVFALVFFTIIFFMYKMY